MRATAALFSVLMSGLVSTSVSAAPSHAYSVWGDAPKYGVDTKHVEYVNPNAPKGGVLRLPEPSTFDSVNPFILKGTKPASFDPTVKAQYGIAGFDGVFESLMGGTADETLVSYCIVCETVEVGEDVAWVDFVIRAEAKFHDGEPIKASDVVFSHQILTQKGHPRFKVIFGPIKNVEALSERKVRFTFVRKGDRLLPPLAGGIPILPEHYWAKNDFTKTSLTPPLGSGPYKLSKIEAGKFLTYERVNNYWGKDMWWNVGANNFDKVHYDFYRDPTIAFEAFKAGEYDFVEENNSKRWATQYDFPLIKTGKFKKEMLKHQEPASIQGFVLNTRRPMFKDRRVRKALTYAYDFEWANKNLFYGQYVRTDSYFPNSVHKAKGLPSPEELALLEPFKDQLPKEVFTQPFELPTTDGSGNNRKNLRVASKLLKEAGWVVKDKKRVNAETGEPLKFEILLISPAFQRIVLPYKKNLERLGIQVDVRVVDAAEYLRRRKQFEFDVMVSNVTQSNRPHVGMRFAYGSKTANEPGSMNLVGVSNPAVDSVVEKIIEAKSKEELATSTHALDRILTWNYYMIFNWYIDSYRISYDARLQRPKVRPPYALGLSTWWWGK